MRILAHVVAWLCVLAMPFTGFLCELNPAFADSQRRVVFYDEGLTELAFEWEAASGPVYGYEVCVHHVCGVATWSNCHISTDTETVVAFRSWVTWYVVVRGYDIGGIAGPPSPASDLFNVNPSRGDTDLNCAVGISDHRTISEEWGKSAGEIPE